MALIHEAKSKGCDWWRKGPSKEMDVGSFYEGGHRKVCWNELEVGMGHC